MTWGIRARRAMAVGLLTTTALGLTACGGSDPGGALTSYQIDARQVEAAQADQAAVELASAETGRVHRTMTERQAAKVFGRLGADVEPAVWPLIAATAGPAAADACGALEPAIEDFTRGVERRTWPARGADEAAYLTVVDIDVRAALRACTLDPTQPRLIGAMREVDHWNRALNELAGSVGWIGPSGTKHLLWDPQPDGTARASTASAQQNVLN